MIFYREQSKISLGELEEKKFLQRNLEVRNRFSEELFDKLQNFTIYYPHNNAEQICEDFNQKRKRTIKHYFVRKDHGFSMMFSKVILKKSDSIKLLSVKTIK